VTDPADPGETQAVVSVPHVSHHVAKHEPQRTDALSFAVRGITALAQLAIPIAIAFATIFDDGELTGVLFLVPIILAVIGANFLAAYLQWLRFTYVTGENDIRVESGIISRAARSVPYERIQDVSLEQKLVPRLFGLVEVRFETGAGGKDELKLAYLSEAAGEQLRQLVRERREGAPSEPSGQAIDAESGGTKPAQDSDVLFSMDARRLSTFGLFEFSLAVFAVLGAVAQYAETFISIELWDPDLWRSLAAEQGAKFSGLGMAAQVIGAIAGFIVLLFIGSATGLIRTFLRDWGFILEKTARGFRRRRGLFTRTDVVMPQHRVQAVKIGTGLVRNRFGWKSLNFVSLAQDSGSANHVVAPFARDEEIAPIIEAAGFHPPAVGLDWHRTSKKYRLDKMILGGGFFLLAAIPVAILAPLPFVAIPFGLALMSILGNIYAWKFRRHALDNGQVISTRGLFAPKTQIASRVKLHSVELSQGPIAQRRGYATLHLGLAGGGFAIPGVELDRARELRQAILTSIAARDFSQLA
jgi:putative membrane protein